MIEYLPYLGTTLSGVAATLGVLIPILRSLKKTKSEIEATTASMQRVVANALQAAADREDPEKYFTLSVVFESGLSMAVPMFQLQEMYISENIKMAVIDNTPETTTVLLRCNGFGHLPKHRHNDTCETVEVRSGVVTHLETGTQYRAGDRWVIPPGEIHSATFQDCVLLLTYRPPLPTAKAQPADLSALHKVYPKI